jgi:hypothetical protein
MKLKVYNKKVIDFVWENMMTLFFVADEPCKLGLSTRQKNSFIIFSHTKSIACKYIMRQYYIKSIHIHGGSPTLTIMTNINVLGKMKILIWKK